MLTPEQRSSRAAVGAYASWANTADVAARMKPANEARMAAFEKQVDPDGTLPAEVRERMALAARKAHMRSLAVKSAKARARKRTAA